jgi:hypothetical protein
MAWGDQDWRDPHGEPTTLNSRLRRQAARILDKQPTTDITTPPPPPKGRASAMGSIEANEPETVKNRRAAEEMPEPEVERLQRKIKELERGQMMASINVPRPPSTEELAVELLRAAMLCSYEAMYNVCVTMQPADRDHILASLQRAEGFLSDYLSNEADTVTIRRP